MGNGGNIPFSYLTSTPGWSLLNGGCQSCATSMKIMLNSTTVLQKYILVDWAVLKELLFCCCCFLSQYNVYTTYITLFNTTLFYT